LNPLDFFYWNAVVKNIKISSFADYGSFKLEIERACALVSLEAVIASVNAFTKRVRKVEMANGKYVLK
jgi:hypothetical protein